MPLPNFFIVGAPKCGTTALAQYLTAHPDVWVCPQKDDNHLGRDLSPGKPRPTRDEWLARFAAAPPRQAIGEASVMYLYSRSACQEMRELCGEIRVIIMLREPVAFLHAWHNQLVWGGAEDILDFEAALAAEPDRVAGRRLPVSPALDECLYYRHLARFNLHVAWWRDALGPARVHVILQDELAAAPAGTYAATCRFLGVRDDVRPDFAPVNVARRVRSVALRRFLREPPPLARAIVKRVLPSPLRNRIRMALEAWSWTEAPRQPLRPALVAALREQFRPEVAALGALLGRDLSHWSRPDAPA